MESQAPDSLLSQPVWRPIDAHCSGFISATLFRLLMVADCTLVEAVVVMVLGIHPALVAMLIHSVWVRVILFIIVVLRLRAAVFL